MNLIQLMQTIRERIYLAALLHDIGKFYQRADTEFIENSLFLSDETKKYKAVFCPVIDGKYYYKHVLWTAQFIEDFNETFESLMNTSADQNNNLLTLACSRHLKLDQLTPVARIIQEASLLSSGRDRSSDTAYHNADISNDWDKFKEMRLRSFFDVIGKPETETKYHLPVGALSLSPSLFPSSFFDSAPDYKQLWKSFVNEFKNIPTGSLTAFCDTLLSLLYKYTSAIPSGIADLPEISLFDHLKSTASFSLALYDWSESEEENKAVHPFLLIGADLSGIKSFTYNIVSNNPAKHLKGRSFYIHLLTESVLQKLLKTLNLSQANTVCSSDGNFYVLAPNTREILQKLTAFRQVIEDAIFKEHGTSLYFAIDSIELSKDTLWNKSSRSLAELWAGLTQKLSMLHHHRYSKGMDSDYSAFFEPGESGGTQALDAISGEELTSSDLNECYDLSGNKISSTQIDRGLDVIKKSTWQQMIIAEKLQEAKYWVTAATKINYWAEAMAFDPLSLGIWHYFLTDEDIKQKQEQHVNPAEEMRISLLNCDSGSACNFLDLPLKGGNISYGISFYAGNIFPEKNRVPVTFDDLAKGEGNQVSRLGILRMGIDNSGAIFKSLDGRTTTLSHYTALNRNLDWFFKGYLNTLRNGSPACKNNTFIVHSGGDDLFIVGKWNVLITCAEEIKERFKQWVCSNPTLNISGGLVMVPPDFPIKKGADEADEAKNKAKDYRFKLSDDTNTEKNAFTFFGYALNWDIEFQIVKEYKNRILHLLNEGEMPTSFVSKIYAHAMSATFDKGDIKPGNALWMLAYNFGKMEHRKLNEKAVDLVRDCKTNIFANTYKGKPIPSPYHFLELINLATRWAELEKRIN